VIQDLLLTMRDCCLKLKLSVINNDMENRISRTCTKSADSVPESRAPVASWFFYYFIQPIVVNSSQHQMCLFTVSGTSLWQKLTNRYIRRGLQQNKMFTCVMCNHILLPNDIKRIVKVVWMHLKTASPENFALVDQVTNQSPFFSWVTVTIVTKNWWMLL